MDTLHFTANITYVEHVVLDDSEFLAVTGKIQDAEGNKLTITWNSSNGMLKAFLAGDRIVGDRYAGYGRIDLTSIANAYAKEDALHLYQEPRMHLRYVYAERQTRRSEATPVQATIA